MADPWDRQEGETARQFARFEVYRSLGPRRTLEAVYRAEKGRQEAVAPGNWRANAVRWRWRERAEAWDAEQVRLTREAEQEELDRRRKAWTVQFQAVQGKATQALLGLNIADLTPRDILAFLVEGIKGELLARGEAQPNTRQ